MKNKEFYEKNVTDASLVRYEINEDHSKELSQLNKIYKGFFNRDPSEFRTAKDVLYYKGGWPSENTPPKAQAIANKIADAYILLSYVGYQKDLEYYLNQRGLKIVELSDDRDLYGKYLLQEIDWQGDKKRKKMVEENWTQLFDYDLPSDPKELLKALLDRACYKQKIICELADKIKLEIGEDVESECDIKKSHFSRAVNLKYQVQKGKDITDSIDKIQRDSESTIESIEIF